uniref:cyclin-dependent kinase n=1 Tax=Steinernema glaseri TaxID=37863 RepID=A0A1I7YFL3_9BILA
MDKYILREELGSGTFGVVHKAEHCETKEIVAVKCIRERWTQDGILQCVLREMSILRQLQHPHIVQLKDVIMTKLHTALVFEYLSKDLGAYIREIPPGKLMEESQLKTFFYQMALAVCFFHRRGVIHRDLKPANVLIVNDIHLKVADFGSSKEIEIPIQDDHPKVVTLSYRAPELLLGCKSQSMAVDVWSLGCIVAEMALKERFFHREVKNKEFPEMDQLAKIYQYRIHDPLSVYLSSFQSSGEAH